jgi:hypothetical protein
MKTISVKEGNYSVEDLQKMIRDLLSEGNDDLAVRIMWKETRGSLEIWEEFVISKEDWNYIKDMIIDGPDVYFGEIFGKHSEVCGNIEYGDIRIRTAKEFIEEFGSVTTQDSGHSFLRQIIDQYDEDWDWNEVLDEKAYKIINKFV